MSGDITDALLTNTHLSLQCRKSETRYINGFSDFCIAKFVGLEMLYTQRTPINSGKNKSAPFVDETAILQRSLKIQDQNYKLQYKYTDALEDAYCTESGEYYYYFRGTDTLRFFCRTLTFDEMNIKITKEEAAKAPRLL